MEEIITVVGKGKVPVTLDIARFEIELRDVFPAYNMAVREVDRQTEILRQSLVALGFEPDELKTNSLSIQPYYGIKDTSSQSFNGYEFKHLLSIEVAACNSMADKVLKALDACSVQPKFEVVLKSNDTESLIEAVLKNAMNDAKIKAIALTKADGKCLLKVVRIVCKDTLGDADFSFRLSNIEAKAIIRKSCCTDELCPAFVFEDFFAEATIHTSWTFR